jgi:hypothetical protein
MTNKLFLVLLVLSSSLFISCKSKESEKQTIEAKSQVNREFLTPEFLKKYDSSFAFQEVDWITYKGIGDKHSSTKSLDYPFTIFSYERDRVNLTTFYNETQFFTKKIFSLFKPLDFTYCIYYSKDDRDTLAQCEYLLKDKKIGFLVTKHEIDLNEIFFSSFAIYASSKPYHLSSIFFAFDYSKKKLSIRDCVTLVDSGNYPTDYDVFQEQHFEIADSKYFKNYDKRIDKNWPEENWERSNREIQYKNLTTKSFFYHFTRIFSYCKSP